MGEDFLSAMETEDLHAKRVTLGSQKAGYVLKAGKNVVNTWAKRYLILRHDLLYYYKTSSDDRPLGVINLLLCTIKPNLVEKKFNVILPTRTYFFMCDTTADLVQWSELLTDAHNRTFDDLELQSQKIRGTPLAAHSKFQTGMSSSLMGPDDSSYCRHSDPYSLSFSSSSNLKVEDEEAKERILQFTSKVSLFLFFFFFSRPIIISFAAHLRTCSFNDFWNF
jgi:hypothetical protein